MLGIGYVFNVYLKNWLINGIEDNNNLKLTSTETRVLYGTYGVYSPICYHAHICTLMGHVYHMVHIW